MRDLTPLRDLTSQVLPPPLEDLDRVATQRQRRRTGALAFAAAVVVVVVSVAGAALGSREAAPLPVVPPPTSVSLSPTETTAPAEDPFEGADVGQLSPDEIRNHPDAKRSPAQEGGSQPPKGIAARIWSVCLIERCDPAQVENTTSQLVRALEMTGDGYLTSSLFPLPRGASVQYVIDDQFLVEFYGGDASGRVLLDASGAARSLSIGAATPVTAISGPPTWTGTGAGVNWIDLASSTLHPVEGNGRWEIEPAQEDWYWGVIYFAGHDELTLSKQGVIWRNADGTFGVRLFDMVFGGHSTQMLRAGNPGTMAVVDQGPPRLLHISTDYGVTWETRVLPRDLRGGDGRLPTDWRDLAVAP